MATAGASRTMLHMQTHTHSPRRHSIRRRLTATVAALATVGGAALTLAAAPASAVTPVLQAGGWVTRTAAGAVTSWSTTGVKPTLTDLGGGQWHAKFPGITGGFGVPAV